MGSEMIKRYFVPCPHCGHYQTLKWPRMVYSDPANGVEHAFIVCESCDGRIFNEHKIEILPRGEWRDCERKEEDPEASYQISAVYSPWRTFDDFVIGWRKAMVTGYEALRVCVNEVIGCLWLTVNDGPQKMTEPLKIAWWPDGYLCLDEDTFELLNDEFKSLAPGS